MVSLDPLHAEKQNRAALRVLDALDRCDQRLQHHYEMKRSHKRNACRTQITVIAPIGRTDGVPAADARRLTGWVRELSQGGLSFILDEKLPQGRILVGIGPDQAHPTWLEVEIVRAREVQDHFWEYGGAFRRRSETAPPAT